MHDKKVDIGASSLIVTVDRGKYVDFSAVYLQNDMVIVTEKPPKGLKLLAPFKAFIESCWKLLISMIAILPAVFRSRDCLVERGTYLFSYEEWL